MYPALDERYARLHHFVLAEDARKKKEAVFGVSRRFQRIDAAREFSSLELEARMITLPDRFQLDDTGGPDPARNGGLPAGCIDNNVRP